MHASIWQTIAETSFWIYVLIGLLIYSGYQGSKQRTVPVKFLWANLIAVSAASFVSITLFVKLNAVYLAWWAATLVLGSGLGWLYYKTLQVQPLPEEGKFIIPGSWITLFIILGAIAAKYYFGYQITLDPGILKSGVYSQSVMILYGMLTGLNIGHLVYIRRALKQVASPAH